MTGPTLSAESKTALDAFDSAAHDHVHVSHYPQRCNQMRGALEARILSVEAQQAAVPEGWVLEVNNVEPHALRTALTEFERKHPGHFDRGTRSVAGVIQILEGLLVFAKAGLLPTGADE